MSDTQTKREFFDRAVADLNLDVRDPFTLLFANACALLDQRDALQREVAELRSMYEAACANMERFRNTAMEMEADKERLRYWHEKIAALAIGRREDDDIVPIEPLTWETIARMAIDYSYAALNGSP